MGVDGMKLSFLIDLLIIGFLVMMELLVEIDVFKSWFVMINMVCSLEF